MDSKSVESKWLLVSFSPREIFAWQDAGATPEEALEAKRRGLTPETWKKDREEKDG